MDEQVRFVLNGFRMTILENKAFKRLYLGLQALGKTIVWVLGSISAYFLMMVLSVFGGIINFYIVLDGGPVGGIQLVVGSSHNMQLAFCVFLIGYGAISGYAKRSEVLAIGAFVWIYYATRISFATVTGAISPQGWLATLYIVVGIIGLARSVVSETKEELWQSKFKESTATFKAYKETVNASRVNATD